MELGMIILIIVALVITSKICNFLNRNTVGTTYAYITRFVVVFLIVFGVLGGVIGNLIS